jgi:hypothetical protein
MYTCVKASTLIAGTDYVLNKWENCEIIVDGKILMASKAKTGEHVVLTGLRNR